MKIGPFIISMFAWILVFVPLFNAIISNSKRETKDNPSFEDESGGI